MLERCELTFYGIFSTRNKILSINPNGLRSTSIQLRERIWNVFYKEEYDYYDTLEYTSYTTGIEDMMLEMGIKYEFPANKIYKIRMQKSCISMWFNVKVCGIEYMILLKIS